VKGIYDGHNFVVNQEIPVSGEYEVVITFLQPKKGDAVVQGMFCETGSMTPQIQDKQEILDSLVGICAKVPLSLDEIKAERLIRQ
jgi:hypothetical protein